MKTYYRRKYINHRLSDFDIKHLPELSIDSYKNGKSIIKATVLSRYGLLY